MKPQTLSPQVLAKLGFANPLSYDIKPDGLLVILDKSGRKFKLPKKDYEPLLECPVKSPARSRKSKPTGD